jgi:hypothetical protein
MRALKYAQEETEKRSATCLKLWTRVVIFIAMIALVSVP